MQANQRGRRIPDRKTHLPGSLAASSILTHARVVCLSFASLATSGSLIKQRAVPPKLSRVLLWMPERAICVSVTIPAPALNASTAFVTAPSEKQGCLHSQNQPSYESPV